MMVGDKWSDFLDAWYQLDMTEGWWLGREGHDEVVVRLKRQLEMKGFEAQREAPQLYKNKSASGLTWRRNGRLDLLAWRRGMKIAVEVDHSRPRAKSLQKLKESGADLKVVILHGAEPVTDFEVRSDGVLVVSCR